MTGGLIACTCGGVCEDGQCAHDAAVVRQGCADQLEYALALAIDATLRATRTQPITQDKLGSQLFRFGEDSTSSDVNERGYPSVTELQLEITVSTPSPVPGPANAIRSVPGQPWGHVGLKKRLKVNDATYEFDATEGVSVAVDVTTSDTHPVGYPYFVHHYVSPDFVPPAYDVLADYTVGEGEPIVYEELILAPGVIAGPTVSAGVGGFDAQAYVNGTLIRQRTMGVTTETPDTTNTGFNFYTEGFRTGDSGYDKRISIVLQTRLDSRDPAPPVDGICAGTEQTASLESAEPDDGTEDKGTWTMGLVHPDSAPISRTRYALRDCPCVLDVTGTIYLMGNAENGTLDVTRDAEGSPIGDGTTHYLPGSVTLRLARHDEATCTFVPIARWEGIGPEPISGTGHKAGAITVGGVDYDAVAVSIERLGPNHYRMRGSALVLPVPGAVFPVTQYIPFDFRLKFPAAECPTGEATCEQFAQPHSWWGRTTEGGTRVRIDEVASGSIRPTGSVDVPVLLPDVPGDDGDNTFTANTLTFAEGEPDEDDPTCGGCFTNCDKCEDVDAVAVNVCEGLVLVADRTSSDPCRLYGSATPTSCAEVIAAIGGSDHITALVTAMAQPPDWDEVENGPYPYDIGIQNSLGHAVDWPWTGSLYLTEYYYHATVACPVDDTLDYIGVFFYSNDGRYYEAHVALDELAGSHVIPGNDGSSITVTFSSILPAATTVVIELLPGTPPTYEMVITGPGWSITASKECDGGPTGTYAVTATSGTPPCTPTEIEVAESDGEDDDSFMADLLGEDDA